MPGFGGSSSGASGGGPSKGSGKSLAEHYKTLGVQMGAKPEQVRKAYRKLALKWHPDKNQGSAEATEKFRQITEAYEAVCRHLGQPT